MTIGAVRPPPALDQSDDEIAAGQQHGHAVIPGAQPIDAP